MTKDRFQDKVPQVDISNSRRSRSFIDENERLWQRDLDRLIGMIGDHVENLKSYLAERRPDYDGAPNLSLAVFGPAGSGKSSFLKTLVEEVRAQTNERLRQVASLDILQPARFGDSDHLVYATIAAGLAAHRERRQGHSFDHEVLTPVLKAYRDLSGDLRVLCNEPPLHDLEPQALAAEVIQRHTSGLKIAKKVDSFLDNLADDLNKGQDSSQPRHSVVLLPVDDLDLSPHHLLSGLRELQAYLLHPRLVPVFCFTDRLAEEILAGEFASIVTHADRKRRRGGRLGVSEQLAVQYLSKCFPIRNRIRLGPIPAALQRGNLRKKEGAEPVLWTLITASTLLFGVPDRTARHPVRAALRPSTLRRQFHVIDAMRQARIDTLIRKNVVSLLQTKIGDFDTIDDKTPPDDSWGVLFDRAAWALLNVHRDVLREFGMQLEDLYSWTPHALRRVILDSLFQQNAKVQMGLWQRWRSLTDSRRSQMISLLAAVAFRPWLPGEQPSGEDLQQIAIARSGRQSDPPNEQSIDAPLALQWFIDLAVGFYLPFGRSVFRQLRAGKPGPTQPPLSGAGWSFNSAPIHAAQAAHDDQKLFPAGMMFLDPFSYASALTTPPRIAACRVLDDAMVGKNEWLVVKKAKIFFLSGRTNEIRELARRQKDLEAIEDDVLLRQIKGLAYSWQALLDAATRAQSIDREGEAKHTARRADEGSGPASPVVDAKGASELSDHLEKALQRFREVADWESGIQTRPTAEAQETRLGKLLVESVPDLANGDSGDTTNTSHRRIEQESEPLHKLQSALRKHRYEQAIGYVGDLDALTDDEKGDLVDEIKALGYAAETVHDDQLLLRIWTCYGYNRGRFWAAVSLWRGLGLIGQLIESHSRWQHENRTPDGEMVLSGPDYDCWIEERIAGILRTHSLRGLVPGRDLGEPSHKGTLELAFATWDTEEQRLAIGRLAVRLRSWLNHNMKLSVSPAQSGTEKPSWGGCFIRRLHGGYFIGSLWQWLDAEFLEHQGKQYGQRRSYYWNSGVALTSWMRVLERYFAGLPELRWLLETCPIVGPFLSRTSTDPFLARLSEQPYSALLQAVAEYGNNKDETETQPVNAPESDRGLRMATRFRAITELLQKLWQKDPTPHLLDELAPPKVDPKKNGDIWSARVESILKWLVKEEDATWKSIAKGPVADAAPEIERLRKIARKMLEAAESGDQRLGDRYREALERTFKPRKSASGAVDPQSAGFEIASMIQQYWKVTAHASAASLFYQLPRVQRVDFFDHDPQGNGSAT